MLHHPYDTPTFKTNALHLVSNKRQLKCLLLLYKWIIQPYLGYNSQRISLFFTRMTHPLLKLEHSVLLAMKGR